MEKTSREYAEKLALEMYPNDREVVKRYVFVKAYLKAVEETNVKELIEALEKLRLETLNLMEHCEEEKFIDFSDEENDGVKDLNEALKESINALNKTK